MSVDNQAAVPLWICRLFVFIGILHYCGKVLRKYQLIRNFTIYVTISFIQHIMEVV